VVGLRSREHVEIERPHLGRQRALDNCVERPLREDDIGAFDDDQPIEFRRLVDEVEILDAATPL
jgi:hypothetical protein